MTEGQSRLGLDPHSLRGGRAAAPRRQRRRSLHPRHLQTGGGMSGERGFIPLLNVETLTIMPTTRWRHAARGHDRRGGDARSRRRAQSVLDADRRRGARAESESRRARRPRSQFHEQLRHPDARPLDHALQVARAMATGSCCSTTATSPGSAHRFRRWPSSLRTSSCRRRSMADV